MRLEIRSYKRDGAGIRIAKDEESKRFCRI